MEDFLEPIFKFMAGNLILFNIVILYAIPCLIGICGLFFRSSGNKSVNFIGKLLILLSAVACCVLGYYALINGIIFTGIFGFAFAWMNVYYWLFQINKDEADYEVLIEKAKADFANLKVQADAGDVDALMKLGNAYFATDKNAAAKCFEQAAEKGADAQYKLGRVYVEMGKSYFDTDKNAATKYFEQAAEKGNAEAQYRLGKLYYEFLERKQEGIEWLKKSAAQNYTSAIDRLNSIEGLIRLPNKIEKEITCDISDIKNELEDFAEELKKRENEKMERLEMLKKEYNNLQPNQFTFIMIARTDEQLKAAINAPQEDYELEAIQAAKQEKIRREIIKIELSGLSDEKLSDFLKQKQNAIDKDYAREEAEKRNLKMESH